MSVFIDFAFRVSDDSVAVVGWSKRADAELAAAAGKSDEPLKFSLTRHRRPDVGIGDGLGFTAIASLADGASAHEVAAIISGGERYSFSLDPEVLADNLTRFVNLALDESLYDLVFAAPLAQMDPTVRRLLAAELARRSASLPANLLENRSGALAIDLALYSDGSGGVFCVGWFLPGLEARDPQLRFVAIANDDAAALEEAVRVLASRERPFGSSTVTLRRGSVIKMLGGEDVELDNLFAGPSAFASTSASSTSAAGSIPRSSPVHGFRISRAASMSPSAAWARAAIRAASRPVPACSRMWCAPAAAASL